MGSRSYLTLEQVVDKIDELYAQELCGLDSPLLEYLIELGDRTQEIRDLIKQNDAMEDALSLQEI